MAAVGSGLLLMFAGIVSLQRFRDGLLVRRLAGRMGNLLTTGDRLLAFAGSVGVVVVYLVVSRLTPIGGREWSFAASSGVLPIGQFAAMLVLMILLPLAVLQSRLASRAKRIGLPFEAGRVIWLPVVAAALLFPLLAVPLPVGEEVPVRWQVAAGCGGLVIAWFVGMVLSGVCGLRRHRLRRGIIAREGTGILLAGAILIALLVPLFHLEERRWMAREKLFEWTPEHPTVGRYEAMAARVLRHELRKLFER